MSKEKLATELVNLIKTIKKDENLEITEHTNLADDVGLDSLELINLILEIEEKYEVDIDLDEFDFEYLEDFGLFTDFFMKTIGE